MEGVRAGQNTTNCCVGETPNTEGSVSVGLAHKDKTVEKTRKVFSGKASDFNCRERSPQTLKVEVEVELNMDEGLLPREIRDRKEGLSGKQRC